MLALQIVAEPENKATTLASPLVLTRIHRNFRNGFSSLLMLEENLQFVYFGLVFDPFSPFTKTFNDETVRLVEAGIADYWFRKMSNPTGITRKIEKIEPQVLTLDHLGIGFLFCIISLTFSIAVFIVEVGIQCFRINFLKHNLNITQFSPIRLLQRVIRI